MQFYVLEARSVGCLAEFYVNDIPIIRRGSAIGANFGGQVNQYVRDGVNELSVVINPGPTPGQAIPARRRALATDDPGADEIAATAVLGRYPYGAVVGSPDRVQLMELAWRAESAHPLRFFPKVISTRADLGKTVGHTWAWEAAERMPELDSASRREIEDLLRDLHAALASGDPEPFIERSGLRVDEIAKAYGIRAQDKVDEIRIVTERDSKKPGWGMQPFDPSLFDLRLCGEGRLVQCLSSDWSPILRELPREEDGEAHYAMWLTKLDGRWHICR